MSRVTARTVTVEESGLRLDRWFKKNFPALGHGRLQKMVRTGQVRIDGKRAKTGTRIHPGQEIRIPPLGDEERTFPQPRKIDAADEKFICSLVLHRDADVIVIDKPAGLAVQGGSGVRRHLDAMLDALRFDGKERPRLVHRLDKDTSGVLVLARHAAAARWLTAAFRSRQARKLYWAVVVGIPPVQDGVVDLPLAKKAGRGGEKVGGDAASGRDAQTRYRIVEASGRRAAWVAFEPLTGRTHQLRAHAAALGTPILGDGKYGGRDAFLAGEGIAKRLHLHARAVQIPRPGGEILEVAAAPAPHLASTFEVLGFGHGDGREWFGEI